MKAAHYWHCFVGIQTREWLRFWQQRTRFASALVRPLLWLVVFTRPTSPTRLTSHLACAG